MDFAEEPPATEIFGVRLGDQATTVPEILDSIMQLSRWQSYLAWETYSQAWHLHRRTCTVPPEQDLRIIDGPGNTALHIAAIFHQTKSRSDRFVTEALALVDRIPLIGECLRDGVITQAQYAQLVTLTNNIDGTSDAPAIDAAIATELRGAGAASTPRLRDMADRIICRHNPDAVRNRRENAVRDRNAHCQRLLDGMARVGITASAEDALLAMAAVEALATSVCPHDPRSLPARRSDAAISQLQGLPFTCQCAREDCTATTEGREITDRHAQIVLHVIWEAPTPGGDGPRNSPRGGPTPDDSPDEPGPAPDDERPDTDLPHDRPSTGNAEGAPAAGPTADSEPTADAAGTAQGSRDADDVQREPARVDRRCQLGFIDGYGVISADHVQDIATRPGTIIRPLNPDPGQPLPTHLPSDPYRFSSALDTFIRSRDGYCVYPGCSLPAWACDLDHVGEFDHLNPARGGQTTAVNGNPKCRYHHLVKTFGDWLDDQYVGRDGLIHTEFITPDGYRIHTHGHTNEELFPALRDIKFQAPPPNPGRSPADGDNQRNDNDRCDPARAGPQDPDENHGPAEPQRRRTRLADKHARRRRERELNRIRRERHAAEDTDL